MKWHKLTEKEQGIKLGHQRDRAFRNIGQYQKDLEALKEPSQYLNEEFRAVEKKFYALQSSLEDIQRLQSDKQEAIDTLQRFVDHVDSGDWRDEPTDKVTYEPHY